MVELFEVVDGFVGAGHLVLLASVLNETLVALELLDQKGVRSDRAAVRRCLATKATDLALGGVDLT